MKKTAWEKQQKRRNVHIWFILLPICIILSAIVIYNNRDSLGLPGGEKAAVPAVLPQEMVGFAEVLPETSEDSSADLTDSVSKASLGAQINLRSVNLPDIRCTIAGRDDLRINLSLALFTSNDELYRELLVKRRKLRVIVKDVMRRQEFGTIRNDILRLELIRSIDNMLESGSLTNLEIEKFKID